MDKIIEDFKTWLLANSQNPKTILDYTSNMKRFFAKTNIVEVSLLTEEIINTFFANLQGKVSQSTINAYRTALRSFVLYKKIDIRIPKSKKPPKRLIKIITEKDLLTRIIPLVERELANHLQVKTVLAFMYYAGLRIEDVPPIKRSQIDLENNSAKIYIHKQRFEKSILISNILKDYLVRFFASEAEEYGAFNMSKGQITEVFRKLKEWFPELEIHPHKMRKSYATNAYNLGMTLEQIQIMLGHKSILTTQMYVQPPTDEEIKQRYLKLESEKIKKERGMK